MVCDGLGDARDLLCCTSCGQHYHGACLDIALTPRTRSGWQGPDCKVCQTCRWVSPAPQEPPGGDTRRRTFLTFFHLFFFPLLVPRRQPGEDSKMLVCEACDKGYHTFCMEPAIEGVPADSWKCKVRPPYPHLFFGELWGGACPSFDAPLPPPQNCRVCSDCGRRPPELDPGCQWHRSYSVCEGCQQRRGTEGACGAQGQAPPPDPAAQA